MAELFNDVTRPVRCELHRGYIRQCLENFRTNSNVLQFIGAEFTGPLHFVEFWLDTIEEWNSEKPLSRPSATLSPSDEERDGVWGRRKPLVALSCTKDVLDAIPQMRPFIGSSAKSVWVLHEPGLQYLTYNPESVPFELNLSAVSGTLQVAAIDPQTGIASPGESVKGGEIVTVAMPLVSLKKE